ncbi:hypothetical protein FHX82_000641 [Amycolatopsis bartoniae]|uniref:DUF2505 domain-containing protein n=1 Tax=Amycolatopsis bartoniae TaxID=941986 RepID=A0A8H9IZB8_9PSEU|nr:DUF2505 domain-containing protein [Amycolatopsis bartoniae]MBB2933621.1 hypothetical protein [Amycolatopsis bartoniae]TVT10793.1 DUF2505 domain-containing protein [Amycolatopsis bartoniae]GHF72818.1 hypothetical protein GCM10017566_53410 [Amycolatopsis bartoniae]
MASRIEHRAEFSQGVDEVFAAQTSEPALRARLAEVGGQNAALLDHTATADGVRFTLRQGVGADKLPSIVRNLHSGDLTVDRQENWTRSGGGYTGTARGTVSGVPGEINVRTVLSAEGGRTLLHAIGEVKIRIPLVGGKLEGFVADQITKLLKREVELSAQWLQANS